MTCRDCSSENQQHFPGELTLAFSEHRKPQTFHWLRLSGNSGLLGLRIYRACHSRTRIKATQERNGAPFKGRGVSTYFACPTILALSSVGWEM